MKYVKRFIKLFDWFFVAGGIFGVLIAALLHSGHIQHPIRVGIFVSVAICLAIYNTISNREQNETEHAA